MKARREHQPIRKKHHRWLLYLTAAGMVFFSIWALAVGLTFTAFSESPLPQRVAATLIPTLIAVAFLLVVLLGSRIFPWRYSVIGPYERSPPPKDFRPHITMKFDLPDVQGAIRYDVGKEGMEITYARYGSRVFIPAGAVLAIVPMGLRLYQIEHDCPEIESPLSVSKEVADALLAGLGRTDS
jgi:hypothetical protein